MRVARVVTNLTCNQNCGFCNARRASEDESVVAEARHAIERALEAGVREIVLTGGEPTLRRDLEKLIESGTRVASTRVVLETNAALIDEPRARSLARAGLGLARIPAPGWGTQADRITRDPGGFERTLAGAAALARAGVELEISFPIVKSSLEFAGALPHALAKSGLSIAAIVVRVPTDAPNPDELADLAEATRAIEALEAAARKVGIPLRLDPDASIPPCVFPRPGRVAHLYALSPGGAERAGFHRLEACTRCAVRDRCPGVSRGLHEREPALDERARPIVEERLRRRLSLISSLGDQIERELVTREVCRRPDGSVIAMHTVRINFHCNQTCQFCFVSTHLPSAEDAKIRAAIDAAGKAGGILALSGGEPTLNPKLDEYARLGKSAGAREIELQTNATRLGAPGRVEALFEAGVDVAFVSLHGASADVSDAVTGAPGTFDETVAGLDAIEASPMRLRINFVFCEPNRRDFVNLVKLVGTRWKKALLSVSFVAPSTDLVPRDRTLVPRYTDVLPELAEGLTQARELGVMITGFESMCGLPLCLVPEPVHEFFGYAAIADGADDGEFVKPSACDSCRLSDRCFGIRRGYAELWGVDELRPLTS